MLNPFDLPGPEFLVLYANLFMFGLSLAIWLRYLLRRPGAEPDPPVELSAWEIAYLAGGAKRASAAVVAALIHDGTLKLDGRSVQRSRVPLEAADPFEACAVKAMGSYTEMTLLSLRSKVESRVFKIEERLLSLGLTLSLSGKTLTRLLPAAVMLLVAIVGLTKIAVGASRNRPVGNLVTLFLITVVAMLTFLLKGAFRSRAGDRVLARLKRSRHSLINAVAKTPEMLPRNEIALAVALYGADVLHWGPYATMGQALSPSSEQHVHIDGGGDHNCGGGGGGGAGGGGCGGCGGCGGG